ncbi:MAG: hypothetical protein JKY33_10895 [Bacteroidia bacterium]|nr:hypothetical protein [Bacteroidia bacterium]
MNFFELGYSRVMSLIGDCLALAFSNAVIFGIIGLMVAVLGGLVVKKYRLLGENKRIYTKWFRWYIPLVFTFGAIAFSIGKTTENFLIQQTPKNISLMVKLSFPGYQFYVVRSWQEIINSQVTFSQTISQYVKRVHYEDFETEPIEKLKVRLSNFMMPKIMSWGIQSVILTAKEYDERQGNAGAKALLLARTINTFSYPPEFWDEVETTIEHRTHDYFERINNSILLIFFVLLLIPAVDIFILSRKKKKQPEIVSRV